MSSADLDYKIAKAQFIKTKTAETRLKFTLMADAAVKAGRPAWEREFDDRFVSERPQPLTLHSELKRLSDGEPGA